MSAREMLDEKKMESSRFAGRRSMRRRLGQLAWLTALAAPLWVSAASAVPYPHRSDVPSARAVPLDKIDERYRDLVRQVLEKPMLSGRGPSETFNCRPEHYCWFLD